MAHRFFLTTVVALISLQLTPGEAHADTKSCVLAHANGQREAKAGRLKEAATLYTTCGSDLSCPEQLRTECSEMLDGVRLTVPSVIFSVIDKRGADAASVKVYVDATLLADGLDGRAVELDPGKYHLRFVLSDGTALVSDIVVREGEKNRLVQAKAEPEAPAKPLPARVEPLRAQPILHPVSSGPSLAAWVTTGVAFAGLATFGTFAWLGSKDKRALQDCAPNCPESERARRDRLKTKFLVADIGLGVGAASAVLAGVLFATTGGSSEKSTAARAVRSFDVASSTEGTRVTWRGEF